MRELDPPDVFEIQADARKMCRRSLKGIGIKPACAGRGPCVDCAATRIAIDALLEATQPARRYAYRSYIERKRHNAKKRDIEMDAEGDNATRAAADKMIRTGRSLNLSGVGLGDGSVWVMRRNVQY